MANGPITRSTLVATRNICTASSSRPQGGCATMGAHPKVGAHAGLRRGGGWRADAAIMIPRDHAVNASCCWQPRSHAPPTAASAERIAQCAARCLGGFSLPHAEDGSGNWRNQAFTLVTVWLRMRGGFINNCRRLVQTDSVPPIRLAVSSHLEERVQVLAELCDTTRRRTTRTTESRQWPAT